MTIAQKIGELARNQEMTQGAREFAHCARIIALAKGNTSAALGIAEQTRALPRIKEVLKSAVGEGRTSGGWGGELAPFTQLADSFLLSLRNIGVFDAMLPFMLQLPLHQQITVASGGATGATISEGAVKLVSKISFGAASQLQERKSVAIVVATQELLRVASNKVFGDELARAVVAAIDASFLTILTTGLTPITSSGSSMGAILTDLQAALRSISIGSDSKIFIIADANTAALWSTIADPYFSGMSPNGGVVGGMQVLVSDASTATMTVVDASQIAAASLAIELDSANAATVQMDSAPDSPPTGNTNLISLWQNNLVGVKATRYWGAARLRSTAVATVSGVAYGNSPP